VNCYFGRGDSPNRPRAVEFNRPYLSRHERKESDRFRSFTYEELVKRDRNGCEATAGLSNRST
jgi:hypothetical protein